MKVYAYCLAADLDPAAIASVPGVAQTMPVLNNCGVLTAVVSELDNPYVPASRENIFAHEHVVSAVMQKVTPLPFRFGMITLGANLKRYVETNSQRLLSLLEHVSGCVQMNVKILVRTDSSRFARPSHDNGVLPEESGPGTRFLARKRVEHGAAVINSPLASELAGWISKEFSTMAKDSVVSTHSSNSLLAVRFLVPRGQVEAFSAMLELARQRRPDLSIMSSGPWAPYHFAQLHS
ncbi:MAG TPA: GvpL/GvpF family gas vesicle protein [Acidobacteriota bacterium]|jgi:hypothetical protein